MHILSEKRCLQKATKMPLNQFCVKILQYAVGCCDVGVGGEGDGDGDCGGLLQEG